MPTLIKYNKFLKNQMNGGAGTPAKVVDFDTGTIKGMLATAAYTPNVTTHETKADITNEVTGGNYTAGGNTISNTVLSESNGVVTFDGDDLVWNVSASGFTDARYLILYNSTGTDSTSTLIGYYDLGANKTNVGGSYIIQFDVLGIIAWS